MAIQLITFKKSDTAPDQIADLQNWVKKQNIEDQLQKLKKQVDREKTSSGKKDPQEQKKLIDEKTALLERIERVQRSLKIIALMANVVLLKGRVLANYNTLTSQLEELNKQITAYNNPFKAAQSEVTKKKKPDRIRQGVLQAAPKVNVVHAAKIVHAKIIETEEETPELIITPPITFAPKYSNAPAHTKSKVNQVKMPKIVAKGSVELEMNEIFGKTKFNMFVKDFKQLIGGTQDVKSEMTLIKSTFEYIKNSQDRLTTDEQIILAIGALETIKSIYQSLSDRVKVQDYLGLKQHGLNENFSKTIKDLQQLLKKNWPENYKNMTDPELLKSARKMFYEHLGGDKIGKKNVKPSVLYKDIMKAVEAQMPGKDKEEKREETNRFQKRFNQIIVGNIKRALTEEIAPKPSSRPRPKGRAN